MYKFHMKHLHGKFKAALDYTTWQHVTLRQDGVSNKLAAQIINSAKKNRIIHFNL